MKLARGLNNQKPNNSYNKVIKLETKKHRIKAPLNFQMSPRFQCFNSVFVWI